MNKGYRILTAALVVMLAATAALAQRPRTVSGDPPESESTDPAPAPSTAAPAPSTVKVKYEGGVFGYNKKTDGTLTFDDTNRRLVFRDKKERKEMFHIPYDAVTSAFADTQSRRPGAADIAGRVFPYGLPALFIKKKYRYLTLQYKDADTDASGTTSFKMDNKEILESTLGTLANKAGLTQRGEIYVRRKDAATTQTPTGSPQPTTP